MQLRVMRFKGEGKCGACAVMSDSLDPMDCSLPGSSIHGIFQARVLESTTLPLKRKISAVTRNSLFCEVAIPLLN